MNKPLLKRVVSSAILCIFCTYFVTGCSTVEGIGKDMKKAGEAISDASKKESSNKSQ
ncbi:MAG: entericidin A/B family lipoprotein [Thiotrichaceae bacterium]